MITLENQINSFAYSLASGILIAFLYDLFRIKRRVLGSSNLTLIFEDFLYWLLAGIVLFVSTIYGCHGVLRGYIFIAIFFGVTLYIMLFSKRIMKVGIFILSTLLRPFKYIIFKLKGICNKTVE